ncbi:MAG: type I DNA topoisomerase [Lachnospiraceae bacterium]|nr:type I DNA topoisomerase [Lachnospiraceae bacterium]
MAKYLVIVESPTKVKTIKKFLGSKYEVIASGGHVRDLPKSRMGIDVENDFEPKYITIRGKGETLAAMRKDAKKAEKVYLATDPDREGEAISWHLKAALNLDDAKVSRITFNEITKTAVKASLDAPREINMNLVDAQQARRILDRLVGYKISPLLWTKVRRGLSAGRVQSAALKLVCDREKEIEAFVPEEYWTLEAELLADGGKNTSQSCNTGENGLNRENGNGNSVAGNGEKHAEAGPAVKKKLQFTAKFYGTEESRMEIHAREEMEHLLTALDGAEYVVLDRKTSERTSRAPLPFTTSTLQQEASKALNFSTSKTMRLAQQLYEGVEIKGRGTTGLITYLRTDSTRVAAEAVEAARDYIRNRYGEEFVGGAAGGNTAAASPLIQPEQAGADVFQAKGERRKAAGKDAADQKNIQDAHEAIRPTDITLTPEQVKADLPRDLYRLYQLIWRRFVASRMAPAKTETQSVRIKAGEKPFLFTVASSHLSFKGFRLVYTDTENESDEETGLPELKPGDRLTLEQLIDKQHFTQPPAHYTEASLVKTLEELGIGRPSTFAPTITTLLGRHYVTKENKNLYVTDLGDAVNEIMESAFPTIIDSHFTANMESLLDEVADGSVEWKTIIRNFYPDLEQAVRDADEKLEKVDLGEEETDIPCSQCGRMMVVKYGPHGKFLACPGFPDCRNTMPYLERIGVPCPKCGKDIVVRKTKKGRRFYACEDMECDYMSWVRPKKEEVGNG